MREGDEPEVEERTRPEPPDTDRHAAAQVTVQLLGQGDLAIELDTTGKAVRHLWTPDDNAPRMWAILRIAHAQPFSKEFSVTGAGGRDLSRLAKAIGDWLKDNSTVLREP